MPQVTLLTTGNPLAPTIVRIGKYETPVWLQHRWQRGEFATYINKNGCGHCCTAMAARLHGVDIDPHREYEHCRSLWGEPTGDQGHWLSASGVAKVLRSLNIPAEEYGVYPNDARQATEHILMALQEGKQVIFTSNPDHDPHNPFSAGYHWVMALSLQTDGTILIANSAEQFAPDGIQRVTSDAIENALFKDSVAPKDMTWGENERIHVGSGYVMVG